jgi:hypothetical protein
LPLDLLAPLSAEQRLRDNYVHQLRQTIDAYLPSYVFIGEALQNALDAVREARAGAHSITITIDLDNRRVTVVDDGTGFPNEPALLFLGGGKKAGKKLAGLVGVGLKVVLFSSSDFLLRTTNPEGNFAVAIAGANAFGDDPPPRLELPDVRALPTDANPLYPAGTGTSLAYTFPGGADAVPERFFRDVAEECLGDPSLQFLYSLENAVSKGAYPNRLSALLACFLRRYTYLGSTAPVEAFEHLDIKCVLIANDPSALGSLAELTDGKPSVDFTLEPSYLTVSDTLGWASAPKPVIHREPLGDGGSNLQKVKLGFNQTRYANPEEFVQLITGATGRVSADVETFERLLFPKLRACTVTIGRIPQFARFLPGGPRRLISARGVATSHDIALSSGQNQQYVRTLDVVVDVDAELNYGKTQITDMHLVANVRKFLNEAYRLTLQNAARNFVGTLKSDAPTEHRFWSRNDLGASGLAQCKVPYDENDVISLFFELTGRDHFQEFLWYGLSSMDTYDGRAVIKRASDPATMLSAPQEHDLRVVEFKLRGASIARDFDREEKQPGRVDLVICYEVGVSPVPTFQVIDIAASDVGRSDKGPYPGVTHVLLDTVTGREVQILPIRKVIEEVIAHGGQVGSIPADVIDTD